MSYNLSDFQKDQLKEVFNIGAGGAANALSKIIDKKVDISVPQMYVDTVDHVASVFEPTSHDIITVILLKTLNELPGSMFLMLDPQSTVKMLNALHPERKHESKELDDMDKSVLEEVGNILTGNAMKALADFLEIHITQSVAEVVNDMSGSIIDAILLDIGEGHDTVMVFRVDFNIPDHGVEGGFYLAFNPIATAKILELTDKKLGGSK